MTVIATVMSSNPDLSSYGWHFVNRHEWNAGTGFDDNRAQMLTGDFADQVTTAIDYITAHGIARAASSYGLKHKVEEWARACGCPQYISNGAAIVAALILGYKVVRDHNSPNCGFRRGA